MERWHSDYGKLQEEYDATEEKYKGLEDIVNALTLKRQQSNKKYSFLRAKHNALCEAYRQLAVKLQKGDKAEKDAEVSLAYRQLCSNGGCGACAHVMHAHCTLLHICPKIAGT